MAKELKGIDAQQRARTRYSNLESERSSWDKLWREQGKYFVPNAGRFGGHKPNSPEANAYAHIYDSITTKALDILVGGMLGGMTSPSRPWFTLEMEDRELNSNLAVRKWLYQCTEIIQGVFAKSNTYTVLRHIYQELVVFGTAAAVLVKHPRNIIHLVPLTAGQYCLAENQYGEIDTIYREIDMTVAAVVEEFGFENCSNQVQNMYNNRKFDQWVTVVHGIEPRYSRDVNIYDNMNMPFMSIYFEKGGRKDKILRESGYDRFRAITPRWKTEPGDVYGTSCPAQKCMGDVKQLMHETIMKSKAIGYQADPPKQLPQSLKGQEDQTLPGGAFFVPPNENQTVKSAFDVRLDITGVIGDIQDLRQKIQSMFYADLFLMLANAEDTRMTATEADQRREEKIMMLGPTIEQLHNELLKPLVELTFYDCLEAGILPPAPQEAEDMELSIQFTSMLAQAMRAIGLQTNDRLLATIGSIAQFDQSVVDLLDTDKYVDYYAERLGSDPRVLRDKEEVQKIRDQRVAVQEQQMAQQRALEESKQGLNSAKAEEAAARAAAQQGGQPAAPQQRPNLTASNPQDLGPSLSEVINAMSGR